MYSDTNKEISVTSSQRIWTINWGAVFAGLVFIYAVSWLLFTLSSAIGLSIVEIPNPHDTNIKSESLALSIALYAWIIGTIIITYFLGGYLAGRFSGTIDPSVLSLHGLVVWSCTIIIAVLLGSMGINSFLSSAASAVKTTATTGMNLSNIVSSSSGDSPLPQLTSSFQPLIASLKQGIKKANSEQKNSSLSENDDNKPNQGNDSSEEGGSSTVNNKSFSSENNTVSTSENSNTTQVTSSNQKVNRERYRNHHPLDRIDSQAMSLVAIALVQGDVKQAQELITSNTELDEKQVHELINSVKQEAEKLGNKIEKKANEIRQYVSGILWLIFISYIVALIVSIFGARCGANEFRLPFMHYAK